MYDVNTSIVFDLETPRKHRIQRKTGKQQDRMLQLVIKTAKLRYELTYTCYYQNKCGWLSLVSSHVSYVIIK